MDASLISEGGRLAVWEDEARLGLSLGLDEVEHRLDRLVAGHRYRCADQHLGRPSGGDHVGHEIDAGSRADQTAESSSAERV